MITAFYSISRESRCSLLAISTCSRTHACAQTQMCIHTDTNTQFFKNLRRALARPVFGEQRVERERAPVRPIMAVNECIDKAPQLGAQHPDVVLVSEVMCQSPSVKTMDIKCEPQKMWGH